MATLKKFPKDFIFGGATAAYQGRVHVRLMPRYPTSPIFIGYNIHLSPTNREQTAQQLRERLLPLTQK